MAVERADLRGTTLELTHEVKAGDVKKRMMFIFELKLLDLERLLVLCDSEH